MTSRQAKALLRTPPPSLRNPSSRPKFSLARPIRIRKCVAVFPAAVAVTCPHFRKEFPPLYGILSKQMSESFQGISTS